MDNTSYLQSYWDSILNFFGNNDFNVNVWGTFLVSFTTYWGIGLLYTLVDITGKPKFLLKYRVQEVKTYPLDKAQIIDLFQVVILNECLVIPLAIMAFQVNQWQGKVYDRQLPNLFTTVTSIVFFLLVREFTFYYSHRLLHHPWLYKRIHKKHHKWISPVAISATYAHPIEHVLSNMIPLALGPIILKSHTALLWMFIVIVTFETLTVHSGFHLPGLLSPEFHDFHHLKFNYNFGTLGLLDWVHGTDSLFRKSKEFKRHKIFWNTTPPKVLIPS